MSGQILIYILGFALLLLVLYQRFRRGSVKQYSPAEVADLLKQKGVTVLVDVRTDQEHRAGSIPGSLHVPLQTLRSGMERLQAHRGKELICYCQSGNRSVSAALMLQKAGFKAASLKGGIAEWNFYHR